MQSRFQLFLAVIVGAFFFTMAAISTSHADTFNFTQSDAFGNVADPGFGSVTVTTVGSDLKFVIQMGQNNIFVDTGSHHAMTFDLATAGLSISSTASSFTALPSPFSVPAGSSFTNSPFNTAFTYAVDCSTGGNGFNSCDQNHTFTFFVLGGGGLSLISEGGVFFTVDMANAAGRTGVVGATAAAVPGPVVGAGFPGLVMALGGLLGWWRRKRNGAPPLQPNLINV